MIAIAAYDATLEREGDIYGCHRSVVTPREPVATIRVTVMASGADLDKFMTMLAAVTGQAVRDPRPAEDRSRPTSAEAETADYRRRRLLP